MLLIFSVNTHGIFLWKIKGTLKILMPFKKILDESNCKPSRICVDKDSEFHNRSMKSFLKNNKIKMHSADNKKNLLSLKDLLEL